MFSSFVIIFVSRETALKPHKYWLSCFCFCSELYELFDMIRFVFKNYSCYQRYSCSSKLFCSEFPNCPNSFFYLHRKFVCYIRYACVCLIYSYCPSACCRYLPIYGIDSSCKCSSRDLGCVLTIHCEPYACK